MKIFSKQKLSILIYSLAGGGAERVVSILLYELKEKYDITLVLMRDKIEYEIPNDIKIYLLENSNPTENGILKLVKLPFLGFKYKTFCQKNNIDISLSFMNRPSYVAIFSKLLGNSTYNIISERTTPSVMYRHKNMISKISRFLIKKLYPKADYIIANAEGNRLDLIDHFGIKPNKIKTIHNLFDIEKIEILSNDPVQGVHFDQFTFVSVGRLDKGKNHKLMIHAFAKLKSRACQLIILGEGDQRANLEQQIEELGLGGRVFLMGFDNNPYKYFSKSDVFVFSSSYEGFPNVLVEALACGLPVISTDCKSGPREILAPSLDVGSQLAEGMILGEYGVLTSVDKEEVFLEAMDIVYRDKGLRDKYRKRAKKRARSFDQKIIVQVFEQLLDRG